MASRQQITEELKAANVPENWELYSTDSTDAFFDCVFQALPPTEVSALKKLLSTSKCNSQTLRTICKQVAYEFKKESAKQLVEILKTRQSFTRIGDYIKTIVLFAKEAVEIEEEPILGVPEVEGYFICQKLNIRVHLLIYDEDKHEYKHRVINKDSSNYEDVSYSDRNCIHLVQQNDQFQAILKCKEAVNTNPKRTGTINYGLDYENGLTALLAIRCALNEKIQDYTIETNVKGYGSFDDILLKLTIGNDNYTYMFQIKHKNETENKKFKFEDLFNLANFRNEYKNLPREKQRNVILLTNANFDDDFAEFEIYDRNFIQSIVNTRNEGRVFKVKESTTKFDSKLMIFSEQIHAKEIIRCLNNDLKKLLNLTDCGIELSCVLQHFAILNKICTPITRGGVRMFLFENLLFPVLYRSNVVETPELDSSVVIRTFTQFNLACISKINANILHNCLFELMNINSWNDDLDNRNEISFFKELKEKQEVSGRVTAKDFYLFKCCRKELPMVLLYDDQNKSSINSILTTFTDIFKQTSVVLVKTNEVVVEINPKSTFKNLLQLYHLNKTLFEENLQHFNCIEELGSEDCIRVMETVNPDAYLQLMCQKLRVEQTADDLDCYIERSIRVPILKKSVLNEFTEEFRVIDEYEEIMDDVKNSNKPVHYLRKAGEHFEWIFSKGSIEKIKNHIDFKTVKENMLGEKQIQAISANAGMGKTTFLQRYRMQNQTKGWCIFVNLTQHATLLKNIDVLHTEENIKIIFKIMNWPTEDCTFEYRRAMFQLLLKNKKIIWLIDGFDEVDTNQLKPFFSCISKTACKILVTTRRFKERDVEDIFHTVCMHLEPFSRENQTDFFKKYLKNHQQHLGVLNKLDESLVGIPLQTKLCAEIFAEETNLEKDELTLVCLFENFLKKKFNEDRNYEIMLSKLSLCLFFDQKLLASIGLNSRDISAIIDEFKKNKKKDYIVSGFNENNEPLFTHRSYAEFLCARWLVENMRDSKENYKQFYEKLYCNNMSQVRMMFDQIIAEKFPLHLAVLNSDTEKIEQLLGEDKKLVNKKDKFGRTALHLASSYGERIIFHTENDIDGVKSGGDYSVIKITEENFKITLPPYRHDFLTINKKVIKLLLEYETEIIKDDLLELNPIGYALKSCSLENANLLCTKFANTGLELSEDSIPLVLYISVIYMFNSLFQRIVDKNPEIARRKYDGRNLFFVAVDNGNSDILRTLSGIQLNLEEKVDGKSPREYALEQQQTACYNILSDIESDVQIKKIATHIESFKIDDQGTTLLHLVAMKGNLNLLNDLCGYKKLGFQGRNLLHYASQSDNVQVLTQVLELGFDIDCIDNQATTPLHLAATKGNLEVFNYLLRKGADYNKVGFHGSNLLHYSSQCNNVEILKKVLELGFDINCADKDGATPLHVAAMCGNLNMLNELIKNEADYNKLDIHKRNLLHYASRSNNVTLLNKVLELGFEINCVDDEDRTPLHFAALSGNVNILNALINKNADQKQLGFQERNLLHYASQSNNVTMLKRVLELGFEINCVDDKKETPLHLAAIKGNYNVLKVLLDNRADFNKVDIHGRNLLHHASQSKNELILRQVLELDFELNCVGNKGETPLHLVIKNNLNVLNILIEKGADYNKLDVHKRNLLHIASRFNNVEILNRVLKLGFDIDCVDDQGTTPLQMAAMKGNTDIVNILIETGAKYEKLGFHGRNLLHYASQSDNTKVLTKVLELGFEIDYKDDQGRTPLCLAALCGNLNALNLLLEKGANFKKLGCLKKNLLHYASQSNNALILNRVLELGLNIDGVDEQGTTPLHVAAVCGNLTTFKILMENGADSYKLGCVGRNLLHYASQFESEAVLNLVLELSFEIDCVDKQGVTPLQLAASKSNIKAVNILIENGADCNKLGFQGRNLLHYASQSGSIPMLERILEIGFEINCVDSDGATPLHLAALCDNLNMMNALIEKGADYNQLDCFGRSLLQYRVLAVQTKLKKLQRSCRKVCYNKNDLFSLYIM